MFMISPNRFKTNPDFQKAVINNSLMLYNLMNKKYQNKVKHQHKKIADGTCSYFDCTNIGKMYMKYLKEIKENPLKKK